VSCAPFAGAVIAGVFGGTNGALNQIGGLIVDGTVICDPVAATYARTTPLSVRGADVRSAEAEHAVDRYLRHPEGDSGPCPFVMNRT
jgi:hypothetical protein